MRVKFSQPLVVNDLEDFGRYGEIAVTAGRRPFAPTQLTAAGAGTPELSQRDAARSLWLDDGNTRTHPRPLEWVGTRFDAAHPLRAGQTFRRLEGVAFHAFGRNLVEVTDFALDRRANPRLAPAGLDLPAGLRIVTFNVENYFNRAFSGPAFPTERGARTAKEFACQRSKLIAGLSALHPALAGLQEIENDGYGADGALANLLAALNRAVPGAPYRHVRAPTPRLGDDLIAPALVYDSRRLAPVGETAVLDRGTSEAADVGLARPALAASFRVRPRGYTFTVAVVHLRSKRSPCGNRLDNFFGAGHCALARKAATAAVSRWLAQDPTGVRTPARLLLGDFNAYPKEAAIALLREAGWADLVARDVPAGTRYTELYDGDVGELDYIFASAAIVPRIAGAAIWHNDADEDPAFAYAGARPACSGAAIPYRASDHDPVIAILNP